jgi:hypothetical protein
VAHKAVWARLGRAMAAGETAFDALSRAVPTTIAGARAAIEYLMAIEYSQHVSVLHTYLAEALLPTPCFGGIVARWMTDV